ncbi:MAG: heme exporter protein CcmB, partial [Anaerococcus sp.]|nr:heme exporter protein CcmB [Anaerococcus sp.]
MMRALLARELRLAWRSGAEILNPLWFFLIVITLFPFGVGAAPQLLAQIAPGVVWVAALLAALLVMDRLFRDDWQDGSLEQLMLLPTPLVAVVLVKVVAHWMMSGLPLLIVSPLAALLLGMSLHDAGVLALTLLLGTPTLSFLGAVGVGLTVGLKRGGVLLSLLVLPLAVPLLIFATLVFTIVVTGVYGWAIERIAYRPLRNSTRLAPLISAIGMSLILQNYVQLSQGPNQQGIPTLLSGALRMTVGDGVVQITWTKVFILVAALVGMLILTWIIQYTRLGRICRATQQDRRMAAILGINTDRVISLVFVIGAAMAGLAGVLVTMNYGTFDFYIGFIIGIKAFTAAVLGGIGSLPGAMLGGLL